MVFFLVNPTDFLYIFVSIRVLLRAYDEKNVCLDEARKLDTKNITCASHVHMKITFCALN